ncbi:MAG TPA: terminase, partial [Actinomycetota bacterium]|nr:terminase [Actinomycetota bacterium]
MGIGYDPWQDQLGQVILGKRADGKYAATIGGVKLSIPRQVGKTFFVGTLVMMLCLLFPGLTVVWTAHRTRTSTQTFRTLQGLARSKRIRPFVAAIRRANGEQEIGFTNGSVIMFGAREQGFGRGFDEVDIEVFDEDQILTEKALEDMLAATNQSRHPAGALVFYMGTPPRPTDPGEVATSRRREALAGEATDSVYLEMSADPDADLDDHKQWAKANASFPLRTPMESMLRLRKQLPSDDSWRREGLGIWDSDARGNMFDLAAWGLLYDAKAEPPAGEWVLTVDVNPHRTAAAVGVAGIGRSGKPLVFVQTFRELGEVVPFLARQTTSRRVVEIALHPQGQAGALLPDLIEADLERLVQRLNTTHLG